MYKGYILDVRLDISKVKGVIHVQYIRNCKYWMHTLSLC